MSKIVCPHCNRKIGIPDKFTNKEGYCPHCEKEIKFKSPAKIKIGRLGQKNLSYFNVKNLKLIGIVFGIPILILVFLNYRFNYGLWYCINSVGFSIGLFCEKTCILIIRFLSWSAPKIAILSMISFILAIYFTPSIVASNRKHRNKTAILILNIFFGWTLLGWVGALIWAVIRIKKEDPK